MILKEGNVFFVRIDCKIGNQLPSEQDVQDCMEYLQEIAQERMLVAGLFGDMQNQEVDGAMVLFEAKSLHEANEIANNDPIIKRGFYRCEVCQWSVMFTSQEVKNG